MKICHLFCGFLIFNGSFKKKRKKERKISDILVKVIPKSFHFERPEKKDQLERQCWLTRKKKKLSHNCQGSY